MTERPGAGNRRTETDAGSASVLHGASGAKLRKERSGSGPPDLHLPRCGVDAPRPETTDAQGVRVAEPRFPASALGKNSSRELQLSVRGGEDKTIRGPAGGASAPPGALPGPSRRAWPADSAAGTSAPCPGPARRAETPGPAGPTLTRQHERRRWVLLPSSLWPRLSVTEMKSRCGAGGAGGYMTAGERARGTPPAGGVKRPGCERNRRLCSSHNSEQPSQLRQHPAHRAHSQCACAAPS